MIEAEVGDLAPGESRTVRLDATAAQVGATSTKSSPSPRAGCELRLRCALEVVAGRRKAEQWLLVRRRTLR